MAEATKTKTRNKSKKSASIKPKRTVLVPVGDIRVGDSIATSITSEGMSLRSLKITDRTECGSRWRTHVHLNKSMCYDSRAMVYRIA